MSRVLRVLSLLFLSFLSTTAYSAESLESIFDKLKSEVDGVEFATLNITTELEINSLAYSSSTKEDECIVTVHPDIVDGSLPEELAFILGHELAHCSLRHHRSLDLDSPDSQRQAWTQEYEADALGLMIASLAGYDARSVFEFYLSVDPGGLMHPPGAVRIKALHGGLREYPSELVSLNQLLSQVTH